jgi:hypothetical protein
VLHTAVAVAVVVVVVVNLVTAAIIHSIVSLGDLAFRRRPRRPWLFNSGHTGQITGVCINRTLPTLPLKFDKSNKPHDRNPRTASALRAAWL